MKKICQYCAHRKTMQNGANNELCQMRKDMNSKDPCSLFTYFPIAWHPANCPAKVKGERDEVLLLVVRIVSQKEVFEQIPYCYLRDGTWDDFVYAFRVKYWAYHQGLLNLIKFEVDL